MQSVKSFLRNGDCCRVAKKEQCLFKFRDHACMAIELCANYSSSSPEERQAHLDLHVEAMATKRGRIPEILLETLNRYQVTALYGSPKYFCMAFDSTLSESSNKSEGFGQSLQ